MGGDLFVDSTLTSMHTVASQARERAVGSFGRMSSAALRIGDVVQILVTLHDNQHDVAASQFRAYAQRPHETRQIHAVGGMHAVDFVDVTLLGLHAFANVHRDACGTAFGHGSPPHLALSAVAQLLVAMRYGRRPAAEESLREYQQARP